jgi:hypothetical protein
MVYYSKDMKLNIFTKKANPQKINVSHNKKELTQFVSGQFKQLVKKNLRVPITLYHL